MGRVWSIDSAPEHLRYADEVVRVRLRKLILTAPIGLMALIAGWYIASRLLAPARATAIETLAAPGEGEQSFDGRFRIGTYNIAHGRGFRLGTSNWDGGTRNQQLQRLQEIGRLLRRHDLDIVVLNEVDFSCTWSHGIDQAVVVGKAGGFPYLARQANYDLSLPFFRVWSGNAILSRLPITEAVICRFPPHSRTEELLAGNHDSLLTTIRLSEERSLMVWGVHLEFRSEQTRLTAAKVIEDRAPDLSVPLIVAGDLNSTRSELPRSSAAGSAIDRLLTSRLFKVWPTNLLEQTNYCTFPAEYPDRTIDWILVPQDWQIVDGEVAPDQLSDHLLVHLTVDMAAAEPHPSDPAQIATAPRPRY
jgi:endonuclease/exonuclease/phosphatase family metal-dependent hydrolase